LNAVAPQFAERALIMAPVGRDALVAKAILRDARLNCDICVDVTELTEQISAGADLAIVTEEAVRTFDLRPLAAWIATQPAWSDFPFVVLTRHGGGLERNPDAANLVGVLGNVTFLERPFHPTTLISVVRSGLRGRARQHECRRLNEQLESRVQERTLELATANRQLLAQIEEREKVETTLRRIQRLEAVGQLTSGVAHDFNNLLTVVLGNISFLEKGFAAQHIDGKLSQRLGYMRSAAERGAKLTDQLLAFSRRQRLEPKAVDLNEAVAGMRDLLQSTMGGHIRVDTRLQRGLWPALVDPTQLELAVLNLAINARDAMADGGTLVVQTSNMTLDYPVYPEQPAAGEYVMISVSDTGTGMSEEVLNKAFEPFFTTKKIGKGSGLGLSQVLGFAKQSGGGVRIESSEGDGTTIFIYMPRATVRVRPLDSASPPAPEFAGADILLVDDDNAVREVTAAMLRDLGYVVHEAGSGGAALDILQHMPAIDLMLVDFAMPGMSGADVARQARLIRPALAIVFVTGFADRRALGDVSENRIIGKPFGQEELARKVGAALAEARATNVIRLRR
jgi:signal transduction histidine kinase/CheY-like chemotaxis protein